jgi:excisionase family DNA binding protein
VSQLVNDKHYTVAEVSESWALSKDTIRRIFLVEEGVLKIVRPGTRYKRSHTTLRIPDSVMRRVHARMCGKVA